MAAVAAIVVSCIAESPETLVNGHAVDFGTYTEQFQTRSEVKRAIPDGGSMGVYAYLHDNSNWTTAEAANKLRPTSCGTSRLPIMPTVTRSSTAR